MRERERERESEREKDRKRGKRRGTRYPREYIKSIMYIKNRVQWKTGDNIKGLISF